MCVRSIPVRPGGRRVRSGAISPFPCAMGVVGFHQVRSVHSRTSWRWSWSFGSVPSISVLHWVRRVRSGAFAPFRAPWGSLGCIGSIPLCPTYRRVRSVHSRAPSGSSDSFVCILFIPVRPADRRALSRVLSAHYRAPWCAFGQFRCAVGVVGFVRVRSVHSRASWGS